MRMAIIVCCSMVVRSTVRIAVGVRFASSNHSSASKLRATRVVWILKSMIMVV